LGRHPHSAQRKWGCAHILWRGLPSPKLRLKGGRGKIGLLSMPRPRPEKSLWSGVEGRAVPSLPRSPVEGRGRRGGKKDKRAGRKKSGARGRFTTTSQHLPRRGRKTSAMEAKACFKRRSQQKRRVYRGTLRNFRRAPRKDVWR